MGLIGISGKKGSGKDTVADIINFFTTYEGSIDAEKVEEYLDSEAQWSIPRKWKVKKFADKLKDIVCLLIGCTREQLEDQEFKSTKLEEEWWYIKHWYPHNPNHKKVFTLIPYKDFDSRMFDGDDACMWETIKTTPRLLLQLIGTDCFRDIIHPDIWINSLMSDYTKKFTGKMFYAFGIYRPVQEHEYPDWIITDLRFPNELHAIEGKGGLTIRVNRENPLIKAAGGGDPEAEEYVKNKMKAFENEHESETALDTYTGWDYVIENDGSKQDLIEKVREILIKEKLI